MENFDTFIHLRNKWNGIKTAFMLAVTRCIITRNTILIENGLMTTDF